MTFSPLNLVSVVNGFCKANLPNSFLLHASFSALTVTFKTYNFKNKLCINKHNKNANSIQKKKND